MPDTELTDTRFADLTPEQKAEAVTAFCEAAMHRAMQWDAESRIEAILGREIDIDFSDWAVAIDTPATFPCAVACFSESDIAAALDAEPHPSAAPAAPAAVKMTASELLTKFPDMEGKLRDDEQEPDSLLLDMACPECGHREGFRIGFHGTAEVDDDSSSNDGDHEWDADDHCTCKNCSHGGDVKDFTFPGLDDLIAKQEEPDQDTE
jgi:hypothetical protein